MSVSAPEGEPGNPAPGDHWERWEVDLVSQAYFDMWLKEQLGDDFIKARVERDLARLLPARSPGSIGRKLRNISAVYDEQGIPPLDGYKPLPHLQGLLRKVVVSDLGRRNEIDPLLAERPPIAAPTTSILQEVPTPHKIGGTVREVARTPYAPTPRVDYLERELRNASLGLEGERLVLAAEQNRLDREGRPDLAERVEHSSQSVGDGLGYDVRSFNADGSTRYIEVKSTDYGRFVPFFVTPRELQFSDDNRDSFHLYRLFHLRRGARYFDLRGSLRASCTLTPQSYRAWPA